MRADEASSTVRSPSLEDGNELFRAAVCCLDLDHDFAAELLRDHLRRSGCSVRSVMPCELAAILEDLEATVFDVLEENAARASLAALRRLVGKR